jgi:hypothetical protein
MEKTNVDIASQQQMMEDSEHLQATLAGETPRMNLAILYEYIERSNDMVAQ